MRKRDEGLSSLCAHVPLPICTTHTDLPYRLEKVRLVRGVSQHYYAAILF